jgi:hypothetical protein
MNRIDRGLRKDHARVWLRLASAGLAVACTPARRPDPPPPPAPLNEVGEPRAKPLPEREFPELPNVPDYPCPHPEEALNAGMGEGKTVRRGPTEKPPTFGRLPPELIQKIVRTNYGVFRACYEAGLKKDADLYGRVTARFVIERDGQVRRSDPTCTSMPDRDVVRCVVEGYKKLKFPEPDGGIVTVVYPIMFTPGD